MNRRQRRKHAKKEWRYASEKALFFGDSICGTDGQVPRSAEAGPLWIDPPIRWAEIEPARRDSHDGDDIS